MEKLLIIKLNELNKSIENYDFRKTTKSCFVQNCSESPINSHTIQKKRILSYLEDKTEKNYRKVYSLEDRPYVSFTEQKLLTFHSYRRKLVELGKDEASTISGFCSKHDKTIFKPIEDKAYENTPINNFLHSLRAYVFDIICTKGVYNMFLNVLKDVNRIDQPLKELKDKITLINQPLDVLPDSYILSESDILSLKLLQNNSILKALNLDNGLDKLDFTNKSGRELKEIFNKLLPEFQNLPQLNPYFETLNNTVKIQSEYLDSVSFNFLKKYNQKNFSSFNYFTHRIKGLYPIACCFVANISHQKLLESNGERTYQPKYTLAIFPDIEHKETIIIFSSLEFNHSNIFYGKINILSNIEMEIFVTNLIIARGTNCFISPRFWNKLLNSEKELMLKDKINSDSMHIDIENKGLNLFEEQFKD